MPALRASVVGSVLPGARVGLVARAMATRPDAVVPTKKGKKAGLAAVVEKELAYEAEDKVTSSNLEEIAGSLRVDWEVVDAPGAARFHLTRTVNGQEVRVDVDCSPVPVHGDEEWNEEQEEEEEEQEGGEQEPEVQDGFRVLVTITDAAKGKVMQVGTFVKDHLQVEKVAMYKAGEQPSANSIFSGVDETPLYAGPVFEELDTELQDAMYAYLQERGVDDDFAVKIADYCSSKEQVEYVRWLEELSAFARK